MFFKFINSIQVRPLNFTNYSSYTVSKIHPEHEGQANSLRQNTNFRNEVYVDHR